VRRDQGTGERSASNQTNNEHSGKDRAVPPEAGFTALPRACCDSLNPIIVSPGKSGPQQAGRNENRTA
jgi:hypothetical protein